MPLVSCPVPWRQAELQSFNMQLRKWCRGRAGGGELGLLETGDPLGIGGAFQEGWAPPKPE